MANISEDHWAIFGDGNMAQVIDSKEIIKKKTGIKYTRFILLPSKRIENMYDIIEEQDPETGYLVKEYPSAYVVWLERGVYRSRCIIFPDVTNGKTPLTRYSEELTTALHDTERLLRSAEAAKNRAYQELDLERLQQHQAMKLKTDLVREVARARGRLDGEEGLFETDMGGE
jgi:hypothetical protein